MFSSLLYIGCGDIEVFEQKSSDINVSKSENQRELLKELGVNIQNEKISFDFNQTTKFLKKMEIEMHGKADEIERKIKKVDINISRDMGISFANEKIEIDLNKTKKMFQEINILMKEVLLDKNSSRY